jgi:hypothetical protein
MVRQEAKKDISGFAGRILGQRVAGYLRILAEAACGKPVVSGRRDGEYVGGL